MRLLKVLRLTSLVVLAAAGCTDVPTDVVGEAGEPSSVTITATSALGEKLYRDRRFSVGFNQSCATCHEPAQGFAAPSLTAVTLGSVVEGSVPGRFGDRKPPTAAYATIAPLFSGGNNPVGGNFWDGRATGDVLGNPAADQAMGPFLNPKEQALPDMACVAFRVSTSAYVSEFTAVWGDEVLGIQFPRGTNALCRTPHDAVGEYIVLTPEERESARNVYVDVARSIAAFEATLNRYSSRVDTGRLNATQLEGQKLFTGKAKCQQCHTAGAGAAFTDFAYHNLGVPKNPENPVYNYTSGLADPGLGGFTGNAAHMGKFKTPTVRNAGVGNNRTYMHNGVLTSLKQVVDFYNTRDVLPVCTPAQIAALHPSEYGSFDPDGTGPLTAAGCWPPAETPENLDTKQMGALGLTEAQVDAIVAFMQALRDR